MKKGLGLLIDIKGLQFELSLFRGIDPTPDPHSQPANQVTSLLVAVNDQEGAEIDLVNGLLKLIDDNPPEIDPSLTTIILYAGSISIRKDSIPVGKLIGISGRLGWKPRIDIGGDELAIDVEAAFNFNKETNKPIGGYLEGLVTTPIPGIEFLKVGMRYDLGTKDISLLLKISSLTLTASRKKIQQPGFPTGQLTTQYIFKLRNSEDFTLGDIVTFFVSLVDPSVEKFEFDEPWSFITNLSIGTFLSDVKLLIEFRPEPNKQTVVGLRIVIPPEKQPFGIPKVFEVTAVTLKYEGIPGTGKKELNIQLDGILLGKPTKAGWDPVNGAPPPLPNQGMAVFELRYLGIGQRVSIRNAQYAKDVGEIMRLLRGALSNQEQKLIANRALRIGNPADSFMATDSPIEFNAESEILIGLDITLLKFLSLSIIFNDPIVYGLRIELAGESAKNFAGLKFEILYQKITDTIGKYHIDLTLPDFVRHFTVGAVSVTLPVIVIDIFTNGDFKLDLGFPWRYNFERSFAIEVFPFTGAGGFYFNKLSAATATSTPRLVKNNDLAGEFTPVYEFGLGLRIGLGKTFNAGPLRAEISITIQGLIEGVFSYYNFSTKELAEKTSLPEKELYFMIKGGVALVGRLYGAVDFKVIKVEIEVLIEAMLIFMIETYQPIELLLKARVSVKASIKIAFVRIRFSFSLTVKQEFTIDSPLGKPKDAPWYPYLENN